jgi:hypothetical protein
MTELSVGHPSTKYEHQNTEPKPINERKRSPPKSISPQRIIENKQQKRRLHIRTNTCTSKRRNKQKSSSIHNKGMLTALLRSRLLHNTHLGGNLDTAERTVAGTVTRLDIDRIHIIVLILVLAIQLGMTCPVASSGEVRECGFVGSITIRAACGEKPWENAADNWPQEWETGAHDGDVAFCGGPVGGSYITICSVD